MDRKIKVKGERLKVKGILVFSILCLILCTSCKENKWAEWKVQNEMWLEQNAKLNGVVTSSTGLQYKIKTDPTPQDARPNSTSTILCDYRVKLINGYVIEYQGPTFGGTQSASISLSSTIPGFAEGCHLIHNNGDIELFIPCYLGYDAAKYSENNPYEAEGYGTEGTSSYIPPYSTLIYEIHICGVVGD